MLPNGSGESAQPELPVGRPAPSGLPPLPALSQEALRTARGMESSGPPGLPPKVAGERFAEYELKRKIAESGVCEVYQATQVKSGQQGILKRIKRERAASAIVRRRFEFEMELGKTLRHPNLVVVLGSGFWDDRPYLFMQEIRGPSLRQLLQGTAPWAATRELLMGAMEQVGQGLAYVHRAGVCHCDLKPENILFSSPQQAVIIDFGLARRFAGEPAGVTADAAQEGYIVGTPVYMPPERLRGEAGTLTPAADVYAFGAMLYEVLAGRPPFVLQVEGEATAQLASLVARVSNEAVPPMRQWGATVEPAWERLCRQCLEKKPQNRPAAMEQVVADVGSILRTGQPLSGPPPGVVQRITRWFIKGGR